MEGLSWWNPRHWGIRLALWRGHRTRRRIVSDADLHQTIDICAKVAGERIAWKMATQFIECFYMHWALNYEVVRLRAEEQGKLPATVFAESLAKGLEEYLGGKDEPAA